MNAQHSSDHEALLKALESGAFEVGDSSFEERIAECPACRAEWEELAALGAALDAATTEERELLASAEQLSGAPGEELVAPTLRDALGGASGAAPRRIDRRWLLAAAAAAVLAVLAVLVSRPPERDGRYLGPRDLELLFPVEEESDYLRYEWKGQLRAGEAFTFRAWDAEAGDGESPIYTHPRPLEETRLELPDELVEQWPERIRWEVRVRTAGRDVVDSSDALTWRSRR